MITSTQQKLLGALDNVGWVDVGTIRRAAKIGFGGNARQESGAIRSWLVQMQRDGLVEMNDDRPPQIWRRTTAGDAALCRNESGPR